MKLCIAEKPSVAREIANVLGCSVQHKGYLEGRDYYVTWTFGHLCTLKEPHDYDSALKFWRTETLPILPKPFGIKLIANKGVETQFRVIEGLVSKVDEVINCGDAGQEGELIQRWVLQMAGCRVKVSRLWISSLTEEAIRDGFKTLRPAEDYDLLYQAGLSRAIGDWLLGMNATRCYTIRFSRGRGQVLSIGRVQTPTLNMIVERCREIENFKPEPYWELKTVYRDTTFTCTKGRLKSADEAEALAEQICHSPLTITSVTMKQGKEEAPKLFDLTTLQVECNKRFSFSADETLRIVQSLYEKKVVTYPRVDTRYLPDDVYPKIVPTMKSLSRSYIVEEELKRELDALAAKRLPKSKRVFDNSKVTDHHAIIPTGAVNASLNREEHRVFDLIVRQFAANFMDDCIVATTTVLAEVRGEGLEVGGSGVNFKVTGKVTVKLGWRVVFKSMNQRGNEREEQKEIEAETPLSSLGEARGKPSVQDKLQQEETEQVLPQFENGESGPHNPRTVQKQSNPPKYYTEATLLRAMETAGKSAESEEIREAMKENGIGRPSTRAAIIETLLKRGYVVKQRKSLLATPIGCQLIDTIRDHQIKSPELTGEWEHKLRLIERGEYSAAQFVAELKQMAVSVVRNSGI